MAQQQPQQLQQPHPQQQPEHRTLPLVFYTGDTGSGKTAVLPQLLQQLRQQHSSSAAAAGVVAIASKQPGSFAGQLPGSAEAGKGMGLVPSQFGPGIGS
jgi:hypothetical protein